LLQESSIIGHIHPLGYCSRSVGLVAQRCNYVYGHFVLPVGSNSLPKTGLFIEPIQLEAVEIEPRDDPYNLAVFDDWYVPIPAVLHQAQYLDCRFPRGHRVGMAGHHIGQFRISRAPSLSEDPMNGISPGKNAGKTAVFLGHENGPDAAVAHMATGFLHGRVRQQSERILILDNI
jgi:hypothetical protein